MEQLKAFRDVALRMDMVNDVNYYLVNALKHLTEEQKKALADSLYARLPVDKHGRDFLGMPVVGDRKLLVPVIELKRFAEYALRKNGIILPTLQMGELYSNYVIDVIKPKYEKK
jgi:hypothetical protein